MALETPEWFDEAYFIEQRVEQMNALQVEGRQDWTEADYRAQIADSGVSPYEDFLACIESDNPDSVGFSPNRMFNVQEYLLALANFANEIGYEAEGYPAGQWTAQAAMRHMLDAYGVSPFEHYSRAGQYDLISPSNAFDTRAYYTELADALNSRPGGYDGRTDWTPRELALKAASEGQSPFEQATKSEIAAAITPKPVSPEAAVTPAQDWNPWTVLTAEPPSAPGTTPEPPAAPSNPGGSTPGGSTPPSGSTGSPVVPPSTPEGPGSTGSEENPSNPGGEEPTPPAGPSGSEPEQPGNSGSEENPSNPGGDEPNQPGGPSGSEPEDPGNTGSEDDPSGPGGEVTPPPSGSEIPPVVEAPKETIELVASKSDYQGQNGVNTTFKGNINCNYGTFNSATHIDGGLDSVNTLCLDLISDEQLGESKGGTTVNIQNVEFTASNGEKHVDVSGLADVKQWTLKGSPIAITGIGNPECVINIENLHSGGDAFDFKDGVEQTAEQFITINLGDATGLVGTPTCHSETIHNVLVTSGANSGEGVYLNFKNLEYLKTETSPDFIYDLHCNPRSIEGSGTFKLGSLTVWQPNVDGGPEGCYLDLGPASINNDSYWVNMAYDSYGRPCTTTWQNVTGIIFNGAGLYSGAIKGLQSFEFTPLTMANKGANVQLETSGVTRFDLIQHIATTDSVVRLDGDMLEQVDWNLSGSGTSGKSILNTCAQFINIDATGVTGQLTLSDLTTPASATVTYNGLSAARASGAPAEATISNLVAANAYLNGGRGSDNFSVTVSEAAELTGNGGYDTFSVRNGGVALVEVALNGEKGNSETFNIDLGGKAGMLVKISGFDASDSLAVSNGSFASVTEAMLAQFGLAAEIVDEQFAYNAEAGTAYGFAGQGANLTLIELCDVSEAEASYAFA